MTTNELLKKLTSYSTHYSALCNAQAELNTYKARRAAVLTGGKSTSGLDGMPHGTKVSDPTYAQVLQLSTLENDIHFWNKEVEYHQQKLTEVEGIVNHIEDPKARHCIWMYYCRGEKMPPDGKVDKTLGVGRRQIIRIVSETLEALAKDNVT